MLAEKLVSLAMHVCLTHILLLSYGKEQSVFNIFYSDIVRAGLEFRRLKANLKMGP